MNRLLRQILVLLSSKGLTRVAQFVTFVMLARLLTPEEFGWFGMITTAIALGAMVGSLGLRQAVAHEMGQGRMSYPEASGVALVAPLPLGMLTGGVIAFWVATRDIGSDTTAIMLFAALGVIGTMGLLLFQGVHLGAGHIARFSWSEAVPPMVLLTAVAWMFVSEEIDLEGVILSYSAGFLLIAASWFLVSVAAFRRTSLRRVDLWALLRYGLVFALNLSLITLAPRVSMFILEIHHGPGAAGQFYGAVRIAEMFLEVTAAIAMVLFSDAARSKARAVKVVRNAQIACWMFWSFLPVGAVLYLVAPWIVPVVLGPDYVPAVPALQILALSMGAAAGSRIIYVTLAAYGKPHMGTPLIIGSLSINLALAYMWVPGSGLVGGAYALLCGQILLYCSYIALLKIKGYASLRETIIPSIDIIRRLT